MATLFRPLAITLPYSLPLPKGQLHADGNTGRLEGQDVGGEACGRVGGWAGKTSQDSTIGKEPPQEETEKSLIIMTSKCKIPCSIHHSVHSAFVTEISTDLGQ